MDLLQQLIIYIIREVTDAGGNLPKTKLMKLLYLIDLESHREFGTAITPGHWFFFLYGPYAIEVDKSLNDIVGYQVNESHFLTKHGKYGFSYKTFEAPRLEDVLPLSKRLVIDAVLNRWGGEELNTILDYVYFETAPMANAKFRQALDFSSVRNQEAELPGQIARIASDVLASLRARYKAIRAHRRRLESQVRMTPARYDEVYWDSLKAMDSGDRADLDELLRSTVQVSDATKDSLRDQT